MFSYLGVDTRLGMSCFLTKLTAVDFRKPEDRDFPNSQPTHQVLGLWVKRYFVSCMAGERNADGQDETAEYDGAFPSLRVTSYLPLILQVSCIEVGQLTSARRTLAHDSGIRKVAQGRDILAYLGPRQVSSCADVIDS